MFAIGVIVIVLSVFIFVIITANEDELIPAVIGVCGILFMIGMLFVTIDVTSEPTHREEIIRTNVSPVSYFKLGDGDWVIKKTIIESPKFRMYYDKVEYTIIEKIQKPNTNYEDLYNDCNKIIHKSQEDYFKYFKEKFIEQLESKEKSK